MAKAVRDRTPTCSGGSAPIAPDTSRLTPETSSTCPGWRTDTRARPTRRPDSGTRRWRHRGRRRRSQRARFSPDELRRSVADRPLLRRPVGRFSLGDTDDKTHGWRAALRRLLYPAQPGPSAPHRTPDDLAEDAQVVRQTGPPRGLAAPAALTRLPDRQAQTERYCGLMRDPAQAPIAVAKAPYPAPGVHAPIHNRTVSRSMSYDHMSRVRRVQVAAPPPYDQVAYGRLRL